MRGLEPRIHPGSTGAAHWFSISGVQKGFLIGYPDFRNSGVAKMLTH